MASFLTVGEARTLIETQRNESLANVSRDLFLIWMNEINHDLRGHLLGTEPEMLVKKFTITTVVDQAAYALASDFESMDYKNTGIYKNDSNDVITNSRLVQVPEGSTQEGYYFEDSDNTVNLVPTPDEIKTFTNKYIPELAELEFDDDDTVIEVRFKAYLKQILEAYLMIYRRGFGEANIHNQLVQQELSKIKIRYKRKPRQYNGPNNNALYG